MRKMVKLRTPKAIPIVVFLCDKQAGQEMNDIAVSYCSDAQTNLKDEKIYRIHSVSGAKQTKNWCRTRVHLNECIFHQMLFLS